MSIPISLKGFNRLREELDNLKKERPLIAKVIQEAREEGDLSENAGYDAARERQGMLEARISYIESRLPLFNVVDFSKLSGEKVIYGCTVHLVDQDTDAKKEYTLVGPDETDLVSGGISVLSPVAKALLGKEIGDDVVVDAPRGKIMYEIVDVIFRGEELFA
ncbi:MAG: transcription elongation factor GreA [Deltaproteobacteria bacterium]|jgi:transcription elongation factor GreA|nr:transcription elongation factor GreA [Deltaproteobacteria bacterium]